MTRRRRRLVLVVLSLAGAAACGGERAGEGRGPRAADPAPAPADASAAWRAALPPGAPARFDFGREPSAERIALWDIDVRPDGEGLPPGRGSVADGRRIYEARCAACHGLSGAEGPDERLVSGGAWEQWPADRAVGAYWPYATTLFDYTRKAMPQNEPGTLSDDETYAVVGYVLSLNGLVAPGAVLDSAALASVRMPARDRFVPDNRTGGPAIR